MSKNLCNLCKSHNIKKLFKLSSSKFYNSSTKKRDFYTIAKCENCGLVFVFEKPSEFEIKDIYGSGYYFGRDKIGYKDYRKAHSLFFNFSNMMRNFYCNPYSDLVIIFNWFFPNPFSGLYKMVNNFFYISYSSQFKLINKFFDKPRRIMDIGCAMGNFLHLAKKEGWDSTGVDISTYSSRYAREKLDLNVLTGTLDELIEKGKVKKGYYDVVTLWDTLEHVINPKELLENINLILKDGGFLFISTLNIDSDVSKQQGRDWHFFRPPKHLFYYSENTLKQYLDMTDFELIVDDDFTKDVVVVGARKKY